MAKKTEQSKAQGSIGIIVTFVAAALAGFVFMHFVQPSATGELVAKVTQDGEVVAMLPLSQDAYQVFTCDEGVNTVVVQDGAVHIEEADCKGGDCMKQGTIDTQGRLLVCLPHKLIVEIVASEGNVAPSEYTGNETVGSSGWEGIDAVVR